MMSDTTTTFLSDSYIRCQKAYILLVNSLIKSKEGVTPELQDEMQDNLNDVMFYLNTILDNSTPEYWSDEEYAWIEGMCEEMREEPSE